MDESSLNSSGMQDVPINAVAIKKEYDSVLEKNENLIQENFELKKKLELAEKLKNELEFDLSLYNSTKTNDHHTILNLQKEVDSLNAKVMALETMNAEEKHNSEKIKDELLKYYKKNDEKCPKCSIANPDAEQLEVYANKLDELQGTIISNEHLIENLMSENKLAKENNKKLKDDAKILQDELNEVKELLGHKSTEISDLKENLEGLKEEKMLILADLQVCKASESNASRGNSLFAEVEENRQKMAIQREILKSKYINLKRVLQEKQIENNKLKLEIVKIRREEKDDEKCIQKDYANLIAAYKEKNSQLEERASSLEKNLENNMQQPLIGTSDGEKLQFQWVNSMIEISRGESDKLRAELDKKSSDYVTQAHLLFDSQKENRKLKNCVSQLKSDIESLKLELEQLKTVNVDDGISPEATEWAIKLQKQKMVKFKDPEQQIPEK